MWTKIIKNYVAKSSLELYFFSDQAIENITNTMTAPVPVTKMINPHILDFDQLKESNVS